MSDFSDAEDRMLIQLLYQHNARKGKRTSWVDIAAKMKTKKTPTQLRLRVVCLKKRFGNIVANFPRWYFETAKLPSKNGGVLATIMTQSDKEAAAQQLLQKVS